MNNDKGFTFLNAEDGRANVSMIDFFSFLDRRSLGEDASEFPRNPSESGLAQIFRIIGF